MTDFKTIMLSWLAYKDWTQEDLADKLGISKQSVNDMILNTREPIKRVLDNICEVLGVSETDFLMGPESQSDYQKIFTPVETMEINNMIKATIAQTSNALCGTPGFGEVLKKWVLETHLSNAEISMLTGFKESMISSHRNNRFKARLATIEKYADGFGVPLANFLQGPTKENLERFYKHYKK